MKNILIITYILALFSCSKVDYLKQYKPVKLFSINVGGSTTGSYTNKLISDTLKNTIKKEWSKVIVFENTDALSLIEIVDVSGTIIMTKVIIPGTKEYEIKIPVINVGNYNYQLNIIDKVGAKETVEIKLHSFLNWNPTSIFTYNKAETKLDFSQSIDADARFGGRIDEYRVSVNGVVRKQDERNYFLTTETNGFAQGQTYLIKLETIDSDGAIVSIENNVLIN